MKRIVEKEVIRLMRKKGNETKKDSELVPSKRTKSSRKKKHSSSSEDTVDAQTQSSQKTSSKSPKKKKVKKQVTIVSSVLKEWVVMIPGHLSNHSTLTELIESHSGKVVSSLTSKVTHLLTGENMDAQSQSHLNKIEHARDLGVVVIDEEYLEWYIKTQQAKLDGQKAAPESSSQSINNPSKKKLKIERIISRKIYKGEPHYLVAYSEMPESANELISRDLVRKRYGDKELSVFDKQYEKKLKEEFSFESLFKTANTETSDVKKKKSNDKDKKKKQIEKHQSHKEQIKKKDKQVDKEKKKKIKETEPQEESDSELMSDLQLEKKSVKSKTKPHDKDIRKKDKESSDEIENSSEDNPKKHKSEKENRLQDLERSHKRKLSDRIFQLDEGKKKHKNS